MWYTLMYIFNSINITQNTIRHNRKTRNVFVLFCLIVFVALCVVVSALVIVEAVRSSYCYSNWIVNIKFYFSVNKWCDSEDAEQSGIHTIDTYSERVGNGKKHSEINMNLHCWMVRYTDTMEKKQFASQIQMSSDPSGSSASGAASTSSADNDIPIDISHMDFPTMKAASVAAIKVSWCRQTIILMESLK